MPNSNDIKKFPPESDLDLPDQREFVPMEDEVTTAHLSKPWSQEVEEEGLAQSGAQESAGCVTVLTETRTITIPQGAYTMLEVEPWPPLSREQVVELHEALTTFVRESRDTKTHLDLERVLNWPKHAWALFEALERLGIGHSRPIPPTTPVEEPKPTVNRNCWTCKHDYQTEDGGTLHFCHIAHRNEPVAEWVDNYVSPKIEDRGMPPQGADGCPGWSPKL